MNTDNINAIIGGLDSRQAEAVRCTEGPVLIVAGAGSGKTRVLTSRIAYILEKGGDPSRILALTFTKKAAGEMKERIALMVGERKARRLQMGTFHSVFIRFLREWSDRLGYPSSFTIYDTSDSTSAIKRIIKEMNLDDKVYKPKDVLGRISMAKNNLVTVAAYRSNLAAQKNDAAAKKPRIVDIYAAYQDLMLKAGVMDFDDILVNMNLLLQYHPDAASDLAARFDYILVDEYQDTNLAQYYILRRLSTASGNLCVVGDDSQSIYAFRGAKVENILNFQKDYPGCKVFYLEQNYRSTQNIVNAANSLIDKNKNRIRKVCFSRGDTGEGIRLVQGYTESEEALLIASSIVSRMQTDHASYQDFAILYRTNSQSRALEEALRKRNLPYMIFSGNSFFERQEVKDMMAYLKLAVNPSDDESFRRVVNKPARGIGDTTVDALTAAAREKAVPLMRAVFLEGPEAYGLRNAAIEKLRVFAKMILEANVKIPSTDAWEVASSLSSACGLFRFFKEDKSIESQSRAANIEELLNSVKSFVESRHNDYVEDLMAEGQIDEGDEIPDEQLPIVTLGEFLEDISLLSSVDVDDEESANKIALMTVHSAKGLEFPYVYVSGMEENLFPSGGMMASPTDIEEERRLFYVALTRARKAVSLTYAVTRMRNGKHESNPPSRFLRELDPSCVQNPLKDDGGDSPSFSGLHHPGSSPWQAPLWKRPQTPASRLRPAESGPSSLGTGRPLQVQHKAPPAPVADFVPDSVLDLSEGCRVEHNRFGRGTVVQISGNSSDLKAVIDFDRYGRKILLLQYAKMRLVK